jgi:hypothetical protein
MYPCSETTAATAAFWDVLRVRLNAGESTPAMWCLRARAPAPEGIGPDVLFTQICGYPLYKVFRDQGTVLATPSFAFAGCEGPNHCAFFMVRAKDPAERLEDLRGRVFGCNSRLSNSGMNLATAHACHGSRLRIAEGRPFFRKVVMTQQDTLRASIISIGKRSTSAPLTV